MPPRVRKGPAPATQKFPPRSKELADLLASGYRMTIEEAKQIVAERDKDHTSWPFEEYRKAKAMLAAFEAEPQVISTRKPWQVNGNRP